MRRICLTLGASAALLTASLAANLEAGCGGCGSSGGIYAGACGAPCYGVMTPGCCEHTPSYCDHIWDGYCQERHCCGGLCLRWPARWWPMAEPMCVPPAAKPTCEPPATEPVPAAAPATAPMPVPVAPVPEATNAPEEGKTKPPKEEKEASRSTMRLMRLPQTSRRY